MKYNHFCSFLYIKFIKLRIYPSNPLFPRYTFHKEVLNLIKCSLGIDKHGHLILFLLWSNSMLTYSDIFLNIKCQALLDHDALFIIHHRICLAEVFLYVDHGIYSHMRNRPIVIFSLLCSLGFRVKIILASLNELDSFFSFSIFWSNSQEQELEFFKSWVQLTYKAIRSWVMCL